jgi:hypothetical protein
MRELCPSMKVLNRKTLREYVAMAYTELVAVMKKLIGPAAGVSPGTGMAALSRRLLFAISVLYVAGSTTSSCRMLYY